MILFKYIKFYILFILLILVGATNYSAQDNSWLQGNWEGNGVQDDGQSWSMKLSVVDDKYFIEYPSLGCKGYWELVDFESSKAKFLERIDSGSTKCLDKVSVSLEKLSEWQIKIKFSIPGKTKVIANALLHRNGKVLSQNKTNNSVNSTTTSESNLASFSTDMSPIKAVPGKIVTAQVFVRIKDGYWIYSSSQRHGGIMTTFSLGDVSWIESIEDIYPSSVELNRSNPMGGDVFAVEKNAVFNISIMISPFALPGKTNLDVDITYHAFKDKIGLPPKTVKVTFPVEILTPPPGDPNGSDNISALSRFIRRNIPEKGEFEKTIDYERKVANILNQEVYPSKKANDTWMLKKESPWVRSLTKYDPDAEIYEVVPFFTASDVFRSQTTFFTEQESGNVRLFLTNVNEFFIDTGLSHKLRFKISLTEAATAKDNMSLVLFFTPTEPYSKGNIGGLCIKIKEVRIVNTTTGKVYYTVSKQEEKKNPSVKTNPRKNT